LTKKIKISVEKGVKCEVKVLEKLSANKPIDRDFRYLSITFLNFNPFS